MRQLDALAAPKFGRIRRMKPFDSLLTRVAQGRPFDSALTSRPSLVAQGRHLLALCALAATLLPADAAARPLALEDYYRIVTAQAPATSPDGRWVAFIRSS